MRSLGVFIKAGSTWVFRTSGDCGPLGKRDESGLRRFAVRLRRVLLELGGVYVKLGQLLSTRPDLVDPLVAKELEVLLDKCPAEPLQASTQTIRAELGLKADAELPFVLLDEISSASFGCVYRVELQSGQVAAMKVMRYRIDIQTKKRSQISQGAGWRPRSSCYYAPLSHGGLDR